MASHTNDTLMPDMTSDEILLCLQLKQYNEAKEKLQYIGPANLAYILQMASNFNYLEIIPDLLTYKFDINAVGHFHETALFIAAKRGHLKIIEILVISGADPNILDLSGTSVLHFVVQFKDLNLVRLLLEYGANVEVKNQIGGTPLSYAIMYGTTEIIKMLLDAGANINVIFNGHCGDFFFFTPNFVSNLKLFIDAGMNISVKNAILLEAAYRGNNDSLIMLLDSGADINVQDDHKETPLWRAMSGKNLSTIKLLLSRGANPHITKIDDSCILHSYNITDDMIKILLEAGVDVNKNNVYGVTPLHIAINSGTICKYNKIQTLISAGANINAQTLSGQTPLHWAIIINTSEIARLLIEAGADLNIKDVNGITAQNLLDLEKYQHLKNKIMMP